jgi:hypothetical protein
MYYIAGSFGNPEIVNVVSDQEVFDCPDLYSTQEEANKKFLPVRNISAFYDLEHLCMGSHFGTTLSFSRLNGIFSEFFTSYRSNTSAK